MTSEMTRRNETRWKSTTKARAQSKSKGTGEGKDNGEGNGKEKAKAKAKRAKSDQQDKEFFVCGKKARFARECWSRANQDRTVNEVEGATVDSDAATEFVFTIENIVIVKDVGLSSSGFEVHEDGLVMIDSGASVHVCPT